ncbi:MAG TPA: ATP-binding protein [Terriglobales bacterium]|nr:ATP-binding protein [Terriglobales bacterium]
MAIVPIRAQDDVFVAPESSADSGQSPDFGELSGRQLLLAALDAQPHAMMLEVDGRIAYANLCYAHLAGYESARTMIGKPVEAVTIDSSRGCACWPRSESPPKKSSCASASASRSNGDFRLESSRTEVKVGERVLAIHVLRDISGQRRLEEQLLESQKKEALGLVVSGVAHDFNNILTAITLHADLLLTELASGSWSRRQAEAVRSAAEKGTILGRQLLDFVRHKAAQPEVVCLNDVLAESRVLLQRLIGEQNELVASVQAAPSHVWINPGQLQQVILNLMLNARDAMPRGGRIEIQMSELLLDTKSAPPFGLKPGSYVRLAVSDNGVGMDAATQSHVFEPFFTTKTNGNGTGLGLYTVRMIARQSGGTVRLLSAPGEGTRVEVFLPLITDKDSASLLTPETEAS